MSDTRRRTLSDTELLRLVFWAICFPPYGLYLVLKLLSEQEAEEKATIARYHEREAAAQRAKFRTLP
jgi:hypothetical protein